MTNRLFIALEIPNDVLADLITIRKNIYDDDSIKWESEKKLHITLKFLGDVERKLIDGIINSLEYIIRDKNKFGLQFSKFGLFNRNNRPSILWAGLNHSDELLNIYEEIDSEMEVLGFQKEKRKFSPHLTLLRLKGREDLNKINEIKNTKLNIDVFSASKIVLFKSMLKPGGSVYEKVKSFELK